MVIQRLKIEIRYFSLLIEFPIIIIPLWSIAPETSLSLSLSQDKIEERRIERVSIYPNGRNGVKYNR